MHFSLPKNTDISIQPIKSFTDNYIWMIKKNKDAVIVDPGDASPVLEILQKESAVQQILRRYKTIQASLYYFLPEHRPT